MRGQFNQVVLYLYCQFNSFRNFMVYVWSNRVVQYYDNFRVTQVYYSIFWIYWHWCANHLVRYVGNLRLRMSNPCQHSDLTESLVCDISVRSKRFQLLTVLWDLWDHASLLLANTGSRKTMVIVCDLIVSLTVWAIHNEIRVSLTESSHEIPCLLG